MKKRISFLGLLLLILTSLGVYAEDCINPSENMKINEDIIFCPGEYTLTQGAQISSNGITIECDGTKFIGSQNEHAFKIENHKDITIKGCDISNFQYAFDISFATGITIDQNTLHGNDIGMIARQMYISSINDNNFNNNTQNAIFLADGCKGNSFTGNTFKDSAFNIASATDNPDNLYNENIYVDLDGPNAHDTDYEYQGEVTSIAEIEDSAIVITEEEPNTIEEPEEEAEAPAIPSETIGIENPIDVLDADGNTKTRESILARVHEIMETEDELDDDLKRLEKANENIDLEKKLYVNYSSRKTTVNTRIVVKKDLDELKIYEDIPKCIAEDVSEINFKGNNPTIIESDPLIVWNYKNVKQGQVIEESYEIDKVFRRAPTTLAVAEQKEELADDELLCGTKENPINIAIGDCPDCIKKNRYSLLIPLLLVPLIVVGFIFFGRFQPKEPSEEEETGENNYQFPRQ